MRITLSSPLMLGQISDAINGKPTINRNIPIKNITTDSRDLYPGDLFIAIKGERFNGEDFVNEAIEKAAYTLSSSNTSYGIIHNNTTNALLLLAREYIKTLPLLLYNIAITGSVGKSTVKEFLKILLSTKYKNHASKGNYNNQIGLPLSILSSPQDTEILIMEMGMNHPGEIKALSECQRPNLAIITNIGTSHIGNLGSREAIAKAKLEITEGMKTKRLIIPYGEPLLSHEQNSFTFSISNRAADLFLTARKDGKIEVYRYGDLICEATFGVMGDHNLECLAAAVAAALETGLDLECLKEGISLISTHNTRQSVIFRENRTFYADYYNASRESIIAFINWAKIMVPTNEKGLLLGDILELGKHFDQIHFDLGCAISKNDFTNLFLFGSSSEIIKSGAIKNGFPLNNIFINPDLNNPQLTAEQIKRFSPPSHPIFLKASRGIRLERIINCFQE